MNFFLGLAGIILCLFIFNYQEIIISWKSVLLRQIFSVIAVLCGIYLSYLGLYHISDTFNFISEAYDIAAGIFRGGEEVSEGKSDKFSEIMEGRPKRVVFFMYLFGAIYWLFSSLWQPFALLCGIGSIGVGVNIWQAVRAEEDKFRNR